MQFFCNVQSLNCLSVFSTCVLINRFLYLSQYGDKIVNLTHIRKNPRNLLTLLKLLSTMAFEKEKQTIYDSKFEELLGQTRDLIGRENQFQSDPNALSEDDLQLNMVKIFVHLFSDGSVQNWLKLQKFLQFLTDKKVVFKELSEQLEHYTYRLLFQLEFSNAEFTQKNFLSDLKIRVHKIFPKFAFVKLLNAEDFVDYEYKRHRGKQNKINYFEVNFLRVFVFVGSARN